jgi:transposase
MIDSGIDALVSRLLEERPILVLLEATGGFERAVVAALSGRRGAGGSGGHNPRQVRDFARATGRLAKTATHWTLVSWRASLRPSGQLPSLFPTKRSVLCRGSSPAAETATGHAHRREESPAFGKQTGGQKRIAAHLRWLEKELSGTNRDLEEAIKSRAPPYGRTKRYY